MQRRCGEGLHRAPSAQARQQVAQGTCIKSCSLDSGGRQQLRHTCVVHDRPAGKKFWQVTPVGGASGARGELLCRSMASCSAWLGGRGGDGGPEGPARKDGGVVAVAVAVAVVAAGMAAVLAAVVATTVVAAAPALCQGRTIT